MTNSESTPTRPAYLRYLLHDSVEWTPPGTPRPVVYVAMEADDLDARGAVRIEGDSRAVEHLKGSLGELRSSGLYGQLLNELPTPRNLAAVMSRPFVRERYDPVCIAGFQFILPAETAFSDVIASLAPIIANLLSDTLPRLPHFEAHAIAALVEQIELIMAVCRGLVNEISLPEDALAQLAGAVWILLGQTGKDGVWLKKTVRETVSVLEMLYIRAQQSSPQFEALIRHLAGALLAPESQTLPMLVTQLEADWALP